MFLTKIRIYSDDLSIKHYLIQELSPKYNLFLNGSDIFFLEKYSFLNANSYMINLIFNYYKDSFDLSIISGGANQFLLFYFDWGVERNRNARIRNLITKYCDKNNIPYEVVEHEKIR